jgi:hypothetical protein
LLGPDDRESLAEDLLLSITEQDRESIDSAWLIEAHRRDASPAVLGQNARTMESVVASLEHRLKH